MRVRVSPFAPKAAYIKRFFYELCWLSLERNRLNEAVPVKNKPLERTLTVSFPLAEYKATVASRLKEIAKTSRVKGFRPGKTPISIIEQQHGGYVRQELLDEAIRRSFSDTVREKKLRVAAAPSVKITSAEDGDSLTYDATFEIYPEITIPDFSEIEIEKYTPNVSDKDVDEMLDRAKKQKISFKPVDRKSKEGDQVKIDFVGKVDGESFAGGSGEDAIFVIGDGQLLPDFENNLNDLVTGQSKSFKIVFPKDYQNSDLAGKLAEFTVTAKEVSEPILPEIDEDFVKSLGIASGNLGELREIFKKNIATEGEQRASNKTKDEIFKIIEKKIPVDLPESLVNQEAQQIEKKMRGDLEARGMKSDEVKIPLEAFKEEAEGRVRLGILIAEIARQRGLEVKSDQLKGKIEEFAKGYQKPEEVVRWHYEDPTRLQRFESLLIEENVTQLILNESKVSEVSVDFSDLIGDAK